MKPEEAPLFDSTTIIFLSVYAVIMVVGLIVFFVSFSDEVRFMKTLRRSQAEQIFRSLFS